MDTALLGTYVARGVLAPVDDCMAQYGVDPANIYESVRNQATIDGQMYGIPQFMTTMNWLINESAFTDAGLDPATFDWSDWDAIRSANEAMAKAEGQVTALGIDPKVPEFLPLWAKANGVDMLSADGMTAQLDQPQVVEALQLAVDLVNAHGSASAFNDFRTTWDFFGENNQIVADQIGAWPMEDWYLGFLAGTSPDAPVAFAPFLDREGNPVTLVTGSAFAIPTGAPNAEAACEYIATMTSAEAWIAAATERARLREESGAVNSGVYTGNRVADETIFGEIVGPTGHDNFDAGIELLVSLQDAGVAVAANPAGAEFTQAWQDAVNRVLNGEQTAQEALDQAQEEAQAALDEGWSSVE
jgi:multiple sugar transport system substrate-binding protein